MAFDMRILKTSGGCKVLPPYGSLTPNEEVKFKNRTGQSVVLCFPHDNVLSLALGGPVLGAFTQTIGPGNNFSLFAPAAGVVLGAPKNCPFAVYCEATKAFAQGNSDPEIIVES